MQAQKAAATTWKERRARINTISPGVIVTPLAYDEFAATGDGYQNMIDTSAAKRTGTSDEIAEAGAFLLGEHAGFITGTDLLIDGGVIASIRTGSTSCTDRLHVVEEIAGFLADNVFYMRSLGSGGVPNEPVQKLAQVRICTLLE